MGQWFRAGVAGPTAGAGAGAAAAGRHSATSWLAGTQAQALPALAPRCPAQARAPVRARAPLPLPREARGTWQSTWRSAPTAAAATPTRAAAASLAPRAAPAAACGRARAAHGGRGAGRGRDLAAVACAGALGWERSELQRLSQTHEQADCRGAGDSAAQSTSQGGGRAGLGTPPPARRTSMKSGLSPAAAAAAGAQAAGAGRRSSCPIAPSTTCGRSGAGGGAGQGRGSGCCGPLLGGARLAPRQQRRGLAGSAPRPRPGLRPSHLLKVGLVDRRRLGGRGRVEFGHRGAQPRLLLLLLWRRHGQPRRHWRLLLLRVLRPLLLAAGRRLHMGRAERGVAEAGRRRIVRGR